MWRTFHLGYIYFPFFFLCFLCFFFCLCEAIYSARILVNIFSGFRSRETTKDSSSFFVTLREEVISRKMCKFEFFK